MVVDKMPNKSGVGYGTSLSVGFDQSGQTQGILLFYIMMDQLNFQPETNTRLTKATKAGLDLECNSATNTKIDNAAEVGTINKNSLHDFNPDLIVPRSISFSCVLWFWRLGIGEPLGVGSYANKIYEIPLGGAIVKQPLTVGVSDSSDLCGFFDGGWVEGMVPQLFEVILITELTYIVGTIWWLLISINIPLWVETDCAISAAIFSVLASHPPTKEFKVSLYIATGHYLSQRHSAYASLVVLGTLLASLVLVVGFKTVMTSEPFASFLVFIMTHVVAPVYYIKGILSLMIFKVVVIFVVSIGLVACGAMIAVLIALGWPTSSPGDFDLWRSKLLRNSCVLRRPLVGFFIIGSASNGGSQASEFLELEASSRLDFAVAMKDFLARQLVSEFTHVMTNARVSSVVINERNRAAVEAMGRAIAEESLLNGVGTSEFHLPHWHYKLASMDALHAGGRKQWISGSPNDCASAFSTNTYASGASLSRSSTPGL